MFTHTHTQHMYNNTCTQQTLAYAHKKTSTHTHTYTQTNTHTLTLTHTQTHAHEHTYNKLTADIVESKTLTTLSAVLSMDTQDQWSTLPVMEDPLSAQALTCLVTHTHARTCTHTHTHMHEVLTLRTIPVCSYVRVWDVHLGRPLFSLAGHTEEIEVRACTCINVPINLLPHLLPLLWPA